MRKLVKGNVSWVGYMDWELDNFRGDLYSVENGSSQNAYLIEEEKTVLIDTVWTPHRFDFVENLKNEVDIHSIDLIVINHGECDHSGALIALLEEIPDVPIYCTSNAVKSLEGQYGKRGWNYHVVKTGDSVDIGNGKELVFIEMKMLSWPDSMVTYMTGDNILFSADTFGQHCASGELFADMGDQTVLCREAMKYYANILNPFAPVMLKKLRYMKEINLEIEMIAPSHGAIWRNDPMQIFDKYMEWADAYKEDQVTIVYDTMWGGTAKVAHAIASEILSLSPNTVVKVFCISKADKNEIMTEVFKSKAVCVGSPTVNGRVMSSVAGWLEMLMQLKFKGKRAAAFGCYGWSGESAQIIQDRLREAGFEVINETVRPNYNPEQLDFMEVKSLVNALIPRQESSRYVCTICGEIYDPAIGDPESGIPAGTPFEFLPDDWSCPVCGVTKDKFVRMDD